MGGINGYFLQLQALQPPGSALPRDTESVWSRLLGALSDELERVENRSEALVRESDPRTTEEMLTDWERVCGLPDECDPDSTSAPIASRRAAVVSVLSRWGSPTKEYFQWIAAIAGVQIEIFEFRPFVCGLSACGEHLWGLDEVRFVWWIEMMNGTVRRFRAGESACGERLSDFDRDTTLECIFHRLKPAHTVLVIGYSDGEIF